MMLIWDFEILPSRRIGYFPHEDTRVLRGKVEQQDGAMNFYLHDREFAGIGRSSGVGHCVRGLHQVRSRCVATITRLPNTDYF